MDDTVQPMEVVARSARQAREKAAAKFQLPVEQLVVSAEYEPDETDLEILAAEETAHPEYKIEGEPVLYHLGVAEGGDHLTRAQTFTQGLVEFFGEGMKCEASPFGHGIIVRIQAPDPSILIGKQGATLDALQHVVLRCCREKDEKFPDLMLDVGGFREKRLLRISREATRQAKRALRDSINIALPPMSPAERKYVHNVLKSIPGISTESEGTEPSRHIVIKVPNPRPSSGGAKHSGRGRKEPRGGHGGSRGGQRDFGQRGGGGGARHQGGGGGGYNPQYQGGPKRPPLRPFSEPAEDADDNIGNRLIDDPFPSAYKPQQRGGGRGGFRGNQRGGGGRRGFEPSQKIDYAGLPKITPEEEEAAYRDAKIEKGQSRLPQYKPPQDVEKLYNDPNRKLVDEIE